MELHHPSVPRPKQLAACARPPRAVTTRVQRNKNMAKLQAGYLFPEVRWLAAVGPDNPTVVVGTYRPTAWQSDPGSREARNLVSRRRMPSPRGSLQTTAIHAPRCVRCRLPAGARRTRRSIPMPRSSPWVRSSPCCGDWV